MLEWWAEQVRMTATAIVPCESPPEMMLVAALLSRSRDGAFAFGLPGFGRRWSIEPQREVKIKGKTYRIDVAVTGPSTLVAVEVDGQDWHSSPAQRRADYERERALVGAGWTPLRFTGSDVHADPMKCSGVVLEHMEAANRRTVESYTAAVEARPFTGPTALALLNDADARGDVAEADRILREISEKSKRKYAEMQAWGRR